ncbi:MAG TPA: exostosin family protein [Mucilaginibacter sp.]
MINIFPLKEIHTPLADEKSEILEKIESALKSNGSANLNCSIDDADALIIQEKFSYKNFLYIKRLKNDPIFKKHANKIFTINTDDCATGLLKGLYTSLPKKRFDSKRHSIVPFDYFPNELILNTEPKIIPYFLAGWRGNPVSNKIRNKIIKLFSKEANFDINSTGSWFNHSFEEKQVYKNCLNRSKFTLCPSGWAPVTFRIYESMALARCPVIIADQFVPPAGPDWDTFSIFIPEKKINHLKIILEKKEPLYEELGNRAYQNWEMFFSPSNIYNYCSGQLLKLIQMSQSLSVESEFRRWDSYQMHSSNNWTIPQRVFNKLNKIMAVF